MRYYFLDWIYCNTLQMLRVPYNRAKYKGLWSNKNP